MFSTVSMGLWVADFSQPFFKTYSFIGWLKPTTRSSSFWSKKFVLAEVSFFH